MKSPTPIKRRRAIFRKKLRDARAAQRRRRRRSSCFGFLGGLGLFFLAATSLAAPSDLLTSPGGVGDGKAPEGTSIEIGEGKVSTKTGSFGSSIPIVVPPGRAGAQPSLALSYSSQAPLYGDVAAGWSFNLPVIERDYSDGRFGPERWKSSMAGRELVATTEDAPAGFTSYRARSDASYARYQKGNGTWTVLNHDGSRLFFDSPAPSVFDSWLPLVQSTDRFGNEVVYHWEDTGTEVRISSIEYGQALYAGLSHHAKVVFDYGPPTHCSTGAPPVGSAVSFRSGQKRVTGYSPLASVTTKVADGSGGFRDVRRYDLSYDATAASCTASDRVHDSPIRLLSSVVESARSPDGVWTALPAIAFSYGEARDLSELGYTRSKTTPRVMLQEGNYETSSVSNPFGDIPDHLMIDMDGDGLRDLVEVADPSSTDPRCHLSWRKSLGEQADGAVTFAATPSLVPMPTVPWKNHDGWPGGGTFWQNHLGQPGPGESCTVVGQHTLEWDHYSSTEPTDCENGEAPCGVSPGPSYSGALLFYHYEDFDRDGLTDLVVGMDVDRSYYAVPDVAGTPLFSCPAARFNLPIRMPLSLEGAFVGLDPAVQVPGPAVPDGLKPFSPCNQETGDYGWILYANDGSGKFGEPHAYGVPFGQTATFVSDSPVPKQTGEPYPASGAGALKGQANGLYDLDGDGYPDNVEAKDFNLGEPGPGTEPGETEIPWSFKMYRWDRVASQFSSVGTSWAKQVPGQPEAVYPSSRAVLFNGGDGTIEETSRLVDIHGDGLPDLLRWRPSNPNSPFEVRPNVGYPLGNGWGFTNATIPGPAVNISLTDLTEGVGTSTDYFRTQTNSLRDVDGDGRPDLVTPTGIYWGMGEGWLQGGPLALAPQTVLLGELQGTRWSIENDWIDVNGDGLPEWLEASISNPASEITFFYDLPAHGARRGILHSIDNGRGLTVDVTYKPHTDPSVVTMGAGKLPNPTWVVSSTTTTHAHGGAPPATVSYHYNEPEWNQDDDDRWAFRGFDSVVTTAPSGAWTEEHFDYDVDWSGRLESTLTYANQATNPTSISESEWTAFTVQGVTTFHKTETQEFVCEVDVGGVVSVLSENSCRSQTAPLTTKSVPYRIFGPTDATLAYLPGKSILGEKLSSGLFVDAACSSSTYFWSFSASEFRIAESSVTETAGDSPSAAFPCPTDVVGLSSTTYDAQLVTPIRTCSIRDSSESAAPGSGVCSRVEVDPFTGLTLRSQTAEGFRYDYDNNIDFETGVPTGVTTTTYDSLKLYPTQVENALGHIVTMATDPGTGAQLSSYGPNPNQGSYQEIDGFGRTLHEWISIKDDPDPNQPYHYRRKRDITYVDASPASKMDRYTRLLSPEGHLENNSNSMWAEIKTTFDGAGRVIEVYEAALSAPIQDPSTRTYAYDASGNLASVVSPDPSKPKYVIAGVTSTFQYDSLNRKTCSLAPDGSGVAVVFAGRLVKTFEFGNDGGDCTTPTDPTSNSPRAASTAETDVRGRVIEVRERVDAVADTWTDTTYEYDGNSNLWKIVREDSSAEPDITTILLHDFHGNRLSVNRANKLWTYTYDHNGNMLTQVSPGPGDREISVTHDPLNRPLSRVVEYGSLGTEAPRLGVGETTFTYDQGLYGVGHLTRKVSPFDEVDYTYDARGNQMTATKVLNFDDLTGANIPLSDTLQLENVSYNAFDQPGVVIRPSGRKTYTHYHRWPSVPKHVYLYAPDGVNEYFIHSRNSAGLVTEVSHRKGNVFGRKVTVGRDTLGRTTSEVSNDTGDDKISQSMTYYGTSEVATMTSQVGPTSGTHNYTFNYDDQHQLTHASDNKGYLANFTYTPTGKLLTADVGATLGSGTMVEPRHVKYIYAGNDPLNPIDPMDPKDPEILVRLEEVVPPTPPGLTAAYEHDEAGNMTQRLVSDGSGSAASVSVDLVYDAENRLRIRKLPDTTEERYFYDGPNRLAAIQIGTTGTATGARVWFGDEEIEYTCSPTACARKTEKAYIRLGARTVARIDRDSVTGIAESKLVHSNGLGHTLGIYSYSFVNNVFDVDLEVGFQYGAFGEILDTFEAAGADADDYRERFNGKELDTSSGLSYYGYRYFDPLALIWNRSDPMFRFTPEYAFLAPRRANLYSFTGNNPVRYVDPDGLCPWCSEARERAVEQGGYDASLLIDAESMGAEATADALNPISSARRAGESAAEATLQARAGNYGAATGYAVLSLLEFGSGVSIGGAVANGLKATLKAGKATLASGKAAIGRAAASGERVGVGVVLSDGTGTLGTAARSHAEIASEMGVMVTPPRGGVMGTLKEGAEAVTVVGKKRPFRRETVSVVGSSNFGGAKPVAGWAEKTAKDLFRKLEW